MRATVLIPIAAAAFVLALPHAASAQMTASAVTDLNIRSGPGPDYPVIGVIRSSDQAVVEGCIEGSQWCRITYGGRQGWAYAQYLRMQVAGAPVILSERRAEAGVPVVTYERRPGAATAGTAVGGAVVGALVGGPIGAVVGGTIGAAAGATVEPPVEVHRYVTANPLPPVNLEGEVVLGAGLPATVEVRPVPGYQYHYTYVNSVPVLVEPESRRIVYIYR